MIAKYKVPVVIGTTVWLAACAQPPRAYYQPPPVYYVPAYYTARPVSRTYAPPTPEIVPAKPEPPKTVSPKTETARQETTPPPRVFRPFAPPVAAECVGWWRICHFL